jgi:hypothetical protein
VKITQDYKRFLFTNVTSRRARAKHEGNPISKRDCITSIFKGGAAIIAGGSMDGAVCHSDEKLRLSSMPYLRDLRRCEAKEVDGGWCFTYSENGRRGLYHLINTPGRLRNILIETEQELRADPATHAMLVNNAYRNAGLDPPNTRPIWEYITGDAKVIEP